MPDDPDLQRVLAERQGIHNCACFLALLIVLALLVIGVLALVKGIK